MKPIASLLFCVALLASGCSSLRPPAQDQLAWEYEQSEGQKMSQQGEGVWDLLYSAFNLAGEFIR